LPDKDEKIQIIIKSEKDDKDEKDKAQIKYNYEDFLK